MRTTRMAVALAIILTFTMAIAAPAGALAQSAGDEQYVDPFQGGGGNAGRPGSQNDGGQGGATPSDTQGSTAEGATGSTATAAPDSSAAGVDAGTATSSGAQLPRTGLPMVALAALGVGLMIGGLALRRAAPPLR
jgi:hypothetical protein